MGDAYRDDYQAALMQLEALRRENEELRERLERARRLADVRSETESVVSVVDEERVSPSVLALMLVSMFFLTGTVIYAGAVTSLQNVRMRYVSHCPYSDRMGTDLASEGVLRIEVQPSVPAVVQIDGRVVPWSAGVAVSGPLASDRLHHVTVHAAGYRPYTYDAWVHPGLTRTMRVTLEEERSEQVADAVGDARAGRSVVFQKLPWARASAVNRSMVQGPSWPAR